MVSPSKSALKPWQMNGFMRTTLSFSWKLARSACTL
jgi:hypothetical protein